MILEEIKRVLIRYKGIFIIVIMFALSLSDYFKLFGDYITHEQYQVLSECYKEYEGDLTKEKLMLIKNDYENRIGGFGYEPGAYKSIYESACSNMENMEKPFLVYDNGWRTLIANPADNKYLLLAFMIFAIISFGVDSGNKMQNIFNTSVNGRRRLVITRISVYCLFAAMIVLLQGITEYFIAAQFMGLRCPNAPVQSYSGFWECALDISLIEAYVLVLLMRFLGAVIGGLVICLVATIARNLYISIVMGMLIFFEGYFLSGLYKYDYLLPQHLFVSYNTFDKADTGAVVLVSLIVIVLLLAGILAVNNEWNRRRLI